MRGESTKLRAETCLTRRQVLRMGTAGLGLACLGRETLAASSPSSRSGSVILIMLVGGPSQLDTFDPKPDAPSEIRGPFRSIATALPGVRVSEHLPRLARRLDRVALVRSLHHDAAPIHETGQQLLGTGRLFPSGLEYPHFGAVASARLGGRRDVPAWAILPGPIGRTGVDIPHGESAAGLGPNHEPILLNERSSSGSPLGRLVDLSRERDSVREAYGPTAFGRDCLRARRLVEAGVRVVTVNMYTTVFHQVSWDCHGTRPFTTLADYAETVLPTFDRAFTALIDDLAARGLLDSTLVMATGEFGRTPRLNASGGRDHWPNVWSAVVGGGGVAGGQVVGSSNADGAHPKDRPVTPQDLLATAYRNLGIETADRLDLTDRTVPILDTGTPIV